MVIGGFGVDRCRDYHCLRGRCSGRCVVTGTETPKRFRSERLVSGLFLPKRERAPFVLWRQLETRGSGTSNKNTLKVSTNICEGDEDFKINAKNNLEMRL